MRPPIRPNFYVHPVGKNNALDQKNGCTFFDGLDELCHRAKFGEDRTMRAGCRCKNVVFVFCFIFVSLVTLRVRCTVCSRGA